MPDYLESGLALSLWVAVLQKPLDQVYAELSFDQNKEQGFMFTFARFIRFLIAVNQVQLLRLFKQQPQAELSVEESALLLLHHMQQSVGFRQVQQKRSSSNGKNGLCTADNYRELTSRQSTYQPSRASLTRQDAEASTLPRHQSSRGLETSGRRGHGESQLISLRNSEQPTKRLRSLSKNRSLAGSVVFREESLPIFEKFGEPLSQLFAFYAGMGEPLANKMKSMKFNRLLRDAGILDKANSLSSKPKTPARRTSTSRHETIRQASEGLSVVDADLIFVKLTGSKFRHTVNSTAYIKPAARSARLNSRSHLSQASLTNKPANCKLELETFLKALELVSDLVFPDLTRAQAVETLVVQHLLPLLSSLDFENRVSGLHQIQKLKAILADDSSVELMGVVHENTEVFFEYYADSKGHMNYESFVRFCSDFGIFPSIISKARLASYFYTLASLNSLISDEEGNPNLGYAAQEQRDKEVIDSHLFVEAIAMLAIDLAPPGTPFDEAFVGCLQRLDASGGSKKVQTELGLTRGKRGFCWSLLRGLEEVRRTILDTSTQTRQESFESVYGPRIN